jgi:hypothetical protein
VGAVEMKNGPNGEIGLKRRRKIKTKSISIAKKEIRHPQHAREAAAK